MPRFQLRHPMGAIEIAPGEFIVGRNPDCDLVLDDPMASRRHAALRATDAKLWIEDLGSRNGIEINGQLRTGVTELVDGDTITIGARSWQVRVHATGTRPSGTLAAMTLNARTGRDTIEMDPTPTTLGLRAELMDKAFAMGRVDDVVHILVQYLDALRETDAPLDTTLLAQIAQYALRVAGEKNEGAWIDRIFTLYLGAGQVPASALVDEIHPVARRIRYQPSVAMRAYVAWLTARVLQLGPAERFALHRLEGLIRVLDA